MMERLRPPAGVLEIADRLENDGFEVWCVGGAIRDALLGHPHLDWDLATSATPVEVQRVFGARRTIPVGVEFGTVGVLDHQGIMHEVTTFRRDVRTDGRHAEVEFGVSLHEDLARRDFTINAVAFSPKRQEIRDPFGGRADLHAGVVRAVGDPDARMREDRLRALRGIRFAARFGFTIEPATLRAMEASAPFLGRLSPERVKQELDKTMEQVDRPSVALQIWQSSGAFRTLLPELATASASALTAPDFAAKPCLARRPARRTIRFATLLASLAPSEAGAVLRRLRASRQETQTVENLVGQWHTVGRQMTQTLLSDAGSDAAIRRWVSTIGRLQIGEFTRLANALWEADRAQGRSAPAAMTIHAMYRRMLRSAFGDAIDLGSLAVDGDDLRRAGIPPGPVLGKILQELLAAVIEEPRRNTTDWLLQEAVRRHADASRGTAKRGRT
jgi:tRNA nucleotidyltransferase (CCA-adding enzyme)